MMLLINMFEVIKFAVQDFLMLLALKKNNFLITLMCNQEDYFKKYFDKDIQAIIPRYIVSINTTDQNQEKGR